MITFGQAQLAPSCVGLQSQTDATGLPAQPNRAVISRRSYGVTQQPTEAAGCRSQRPIT